MKQAVLTGIEEMHVADAKRPAPVADQVLVEIEVCGICGSDLHIYKGGIPQSSRPQSWVMNSPAEWLK